MPNQTVITREGNRLNSAKILGPPFLYDPFEFGISERERPHAHARNGALRHKR